MWPRAAKPIELFLTGQTESEILENNPQGYKFNMTNETCIEPFNVNLSLFQFIKKKISGKVAEKQNSLNHYEGAHTLTAPFNELLSHWGTFFHQLSHFRQRLLKESQLPAGSSFYFSLLEFLQWLTPALCSIAVLHRGRESAVRALQLKRQYRLQHPWRANSVG